MIHPLKIIIEMCSKTFSLLACNLLYVPNWTKLIFFSFRILFLLLSLSFFYFSSSSPPLLLLLPSSLLFFFLFSLLLPLTLLLFLLLFLLLNQCQLLIISYSDKGNESRKSLISGTCQVSCSVISDTWFHLIFTTGQPSGDAVPIVQIRKLRLRYVITCPNSLSQK